MWPDFRAIYEAKYRSGNLIVLRGPAERTVKCQRIVGRENKGGQYKGVNV